MTGIKKKNKKLNTLKTHLHLPYGMYWINAERQLNMLKADAKQNTQMITYTGNKRQTSVNSYIKSSISI